MKETVRGQRSGGEWYRILVVGFFDSIYVKLLKEDKDMVQCEDGIY